ncbi:AGC protein kinase [Aphanomyces invadans]|uniref:non-specific serine/threonine protein kinase n=1 Tax=Aphanomyces invadans TaxID=157072 RepID=A0A024TH69_9STRA|nr:AGC protein kinase [Aphanomyces invadans]ETV93510.1 AGC protein kinase [Aphanomyces invadans]|eukprot:XP_008877852.1 AGC protein kinase [Aphanomyces invadans]
MDEVLPPRRAKAKSSPAYPQQSSSVRTPQGNGPNLLHLDTVRRYLLKLTPIEGKGLLPTARNPFCTLVLLDKDLKELKGEKRRTPIGKVHPSSPSSPMWSPLKAAVLRSLESANESNMPLGIGVAAAAEEYTFGTTVNLRKAKYVLVKCKDKGQVQTEDLGRLLLALDDLDTSGMELTSWYDLQLHTGMKRVQGKLRLSCRIIREPSRKQLWLAAEQMRCEIKIKDHYLYLKCHPQSFSGRHATEWMLRHGLNRPMKGGITCSTEEEALLIGQCWLRAGILTAISSFGGTSGGSSSFFQNTSWKYYRFGVDHLDPFIRRDKQRECQCILEMEELVHDVEYEDEDDMAASGASSPLPSSVSATMLHSSTLSSRGMQPPPAPSSVSVASVTRSAASTSSSHEVSAGQGPSFVRSDPTSRASLSQKKAPPPITIDDFELLRVLGTGSFGRVVSARHRASNQVFAIKIVHKFGMDDASKATAKRERDVLMEATHPFVASLHFAFQNEDKLYMGMEYLSGGDLRYHIMAHHHQHEHAHHIAGISGLNTLSPSRIKLYAAELVAALAHLHSLHIIYRDLKPENVLVARDGHIKLVDFGLSKVTCSASKTLAGSPEYIAPEVLVHSKKATSASGASGDGYTDACDWWSLGVLVYELYVGRTPFHDANQAIMYRNIAEGPVYIPTEWGPDVASLLRGLIERDVSKRLGGSTNETPVPFDIMNHPYFGSINWDILQAKGGPAPEWVPDPDEVYVDDEFRSVIPVDTPEWRMLDEVDRAREHIDGFTFRPTEVFKVQP